MPLIIGYNISPLIPVDLRYVRTEKPTDEDLAYFKRMHKEGPIVPPPFTWRTSLGKILERITREYWSLTDNDVTCFFPHDPTVPTAPYPVATLIVDLLFDKPDRTPERRREYAEKLAMACREFLNLYRGTTDAKVEVAVKPYNAEKNGFFVTP